MGKLKVVNRVCIRMGVISVRISDELERELKANNVKVGELVRTDLEAVARRLLAKRKMETLAKYQVETPKPVAEIIREVREEP